MRTLLVMIVWLILLPTSTVWTWRFYFWSGENITGNSIAHTRKGSRYTTRVFVSDCIQGQIITAVVVIVFVAAYLFREWVIKNTAHPPSPPILDRLEQLRRRASDDHLEYNNPYSANVAGYYQRAEDDNGDDDNDDDSNPPSGTQSPFASWRDYQQDTTKSQLQQEITTDETMSPPTGTWRSSEFGEPSTNNDYFSEPPEEGPVDESMNAPINVAEEQPEEAPADEHFDVMENMDNILEAIGMRGNLFMLLQNPILMSLMINLCLCVTVWIPYMIGRSFILIRPTSLVDKPLYMLRLVLDPSIDLAFNTISLVYNNFEKVLPVYVKTMHSNMQSGIYYVVKSIHIILHDNGGGSVTQLLSETTSSILDHTNTIQNWKLIVSNVYSISAIIFKRWRQCATEQGSIDRVVCTVVGYMVLISIGSWYLSRNKSGSTNEILRQQGVFIKVLFFMFLELVVFPTVCGVLLDISTLPLFTEYSIKSRFHFVLLNPYSGVFLHWFVGTGFIFHFSVFVALVREVVRPGVLYFIRDPNDPHFHPVQDMVDQPILVLLNHLLLSGATYFMLIMVGMGFVTLLVSNYGGIYPIIWKFDIPISLLPIDLLAVQYLLKPVMGYVDTREFSKKALMRWWHIVSGQLKLSSFMFGGRYPNEEEIEGELVRVPTHDNVPIAVPRRRRMIVPVHPITLRSLLISERTHPAISESEERDTTIVYIPNYFYTRIFIFLFLIWTTGSILVCSISVVPCRNLFTKVSPDRLVHDLYSFALGAYIMIVMSSLLNSIVQKYQIIRQGMTDWNLGQYIYSKIQKIANFVRTMIVFGMVIPFLVGIMMDLYVLMPLRLSDMKEPVFDIYLTMDWAIGLSCLSLFYSLIKMLPIQIPLRETMMQWRNFDARRIMSIILGLCMIITVPSVLTVVAFRIFGKSNTF
ncbi:uncharacterized protein EV154DRAFT_567017 [Mucor mucedo]|uniref:uncharacterized protein n=1 Tax=Mucor mucedo TaxID=29922 RepID=UPI002220AA1C|nr:uncharacterized protein EV154DRAFT_567017 [Mucor mucedo]KAI7887924.1 hypothetical protein EV154DRAFT_567017 [Mucor mucedo]